jgi:hypothetical protein
VTTIAYRDGVIAADSRLTYATDGGGSRKHICTKLYRKTIKEGRKTFDVIIATAGESSPALVFVDWYGSGEPIPEILRQLGGDFTCLILRPDGLYEVDVYCRPDKILEPFYAVGSGTKEALAAMHCGKTAAQAVGIAARIDPYTGGKIVSMTLAPAVKKAKPKLRNAGL